MDAPISLFLIRRMPIFTPELACADDVVLPGRRKPAPVVRAPSFAKKSDVARLRRDMGVAETWRFKFGGVKAPST